MIECKTSKEIGGMGHSKKRKEDARFIQGKGHYVDDVKLPGMVYMDIVRSPYAYAKIKKIDASKALAIPGVLAVVTGKDLEQYNLHWMPTLMSDTQMVLPTDTVMYQAQEVAAVIATDKYIAREGRDAVIVDAATFRAPSKNTTVLQNGSIVPSGRSINRGSRQALPRMTSTWPVASRYTRRFDATPSTLP